jgi:hypothetical protein
LPRPDGKRCGRRRHAWIKPDHGFTLHPPALMLDANAKLRRTGTLKRLFRDTAMGLLEAAHFGGERMAVSDREVDEIAHRMLAQHGPGAVFLAVTQLNECIDRCDWNGRDTFARIVHRIHELSKE